MEEIFCYVLVTFTKNLSAFYKFMKTRQFQFLNDFSIWESPDPILWKKIKKIKELWIPIISKTIKNLSFIEMNQ